MVSREERIASYLKRVATKSDLSRLLSSGPESAETPEDGERRDAARTGIQDILNDQLPTPSQVAGLEALILPKLRPVLDVVDGDFHTDHPLWSKLNDDPQVRGNLQRAIPSIGRIELPGNPSYPYGGTGFVVGKNIVMTNRHVAAIFTAGLGSKGLTFRPGYKAGIDFLHELDRPTGPTLMVKRIIMVHPYWDMALLEVADLPATAKPLCLSQHDAGSVDPIEVAAVGYPAFDVRNNAMVQNDLFRRVFGVKRLQPGTLGGRLKTESFGKLVSALGHDCSTLGGNSGSAVIDFNTGYIVALHFGGREGAMNYGVPTSELAKDSRVVDAGVNFAGPVDVGSPAPWIDWWNRVQEGVAGKAVSDAADISQSPPPTSVTMKKSASAQWLGHPVFNVNVTLNFGETGSTIDIGTATKEGGDAGENIERMVEPWHDQNYNSRTGYDPKFLTVDVPMPEAVDPGAVANAKEGSPVLHYQNFSVVMHQARRLALITASNVTASPKMKKPELDRSYNRAGLSGLGLSDQERWILDPRLNDDYQLPDVFFTRDNGAFDKGHIVRREDVAWGTTYDMLRRANGDTYHVTNCSPQVADFNRSALGEDNWGDLENHVLKSASSEQYCQFAGPVLDPNDEVFLGRLGGGVRIRVKIPSRFWKVIIVRTEFGIASYGFVLEQDLTGVPLEEFIVPQNFARFLEPLTDIQTRAGIRFPDVVLGADQHSTQEGVELALQTGTARRSFAEGMIVEGLMV